MSSQGPEVDRAKIPATGPPRYGTFSSPQPPPPQPAPPLHPQSPLLYHQNQQQATTLIPSQPYLLCHQNQHQPPPLGYDAIPVGYQLQPYTAVPVDGVPVRQERPLPFFGVGIGWTLFLLGFIFAAIPWYVGAFILVFVSLDYREMLGLVACTVAAVLASIPILVNTFSLHFIR